MTNGKNEFFENEDKDRMIKLKYEVKLFQDVSSVLEDVSKKNQVYLNCGWYGKKFRNKVVKQVYKDFCAGISILNKKVPVYIELPHLEQMDLDSYREINETNKNEETIVPSDLPAKVVDIKNELLDEFK